MQRTHSSTSSLNVSLADIDALGFSPAWIVLVSTVLFVMYLTFRPKRRDPLATQPFRSSLAQQKSLERDMQNVIVELSEMTRQMSAQLETRAAKLEQIIRDADAKLAELREATEAAQAMAAQAMAAQAMTASSDHHAGDHHAGDHHAGEFTAIASDVVSTSSHHGHRPAMRLVSDDVSHTEDRWAEVYRLGDEGLTLSEISRRLARPNGEVELILALRPKPPGAALPDAEASAPNALAHAL